MENSIIPAEATSYGSNGEQLYWYVIDRSLYIKGSGVVKNFYEVGYNSSIHTVVIEDDVCLHDKAFTGDENLRYLVVPDDRRIHLKWDDPYHDDDGKPDDEWYDYANDEPETWYEYCQDYPNLMVLRKGTDVVLVYASPKLVDVVIPEGVTMLGYACFGSWSRRCCELESVILPASVEEIGVYAFHDCKKLKNVVLKEGLSIIGDYAFEGCEQLTSLTIPDSVTAIGSGIFCYCTHLASVTLPDSMTAIGKDTFRECSALKTIHLPSNLLRIGEEAFVDTSIDSIRIPDSVVEIGCNAFGCIKNVEYYGSEPETTCYDENYHWQWGGQAINGTTATEQGHFRLLRLERSVIWNYNRNRQTEFQEGIASAPAQFLHTILYETYKAKGQEITVKDFPESRQVHLDGRHLVYVLLPRLTNSVVRGFAAVYRQTEQGISDFATYRIYFERCDMRRGSGSDLHVRDDIRIICIDANGLFYRERFYWEKGYIEDVFTDGSVCYKKDILKIDSVISYRKKVISLDFIKSKLLKLHSEQFKTNTQLQ